MPLMDSDSYVDFDAETAWKLHFRTSLTLVDDSTVPIRINRLSFFRTCQYTTSKTKHYLRAPVHLADASKSSKDNR